MFPAFRFRMVAFPVITLSLLACGDSTAPPSPDTIAPQAQVSPGPARVLPITACGTVIRHPGTYELKRNIRCSEDLGIVIEASHVTLRLAGHRVVFVGRYGIDAPSGIVVGAERDVTILGPGSVDSFAYPVVIHPLRGGVLRGIAIREFEDVGLTVSGSTDILIEDNMIAGNDYEAVTMEGSHIEFRHNLVAGGEQGVELRGDSNRVMGNTFEAGSRISPRLALAIQGQANVVRNNRFRHLSAIGIQLLAGSAGNRVIENDVTGSDIVDDNGCEANTWRDNTFLYEYPDCLD